MQVKKVLVKYQYLLRFVASLCLILYVPWLLFSLSVVKRSYSELLARNETNYRETVTSFHTYFLEELDILKNHAISFAYDNSSLDSKIVKETIETHPYYYLGAADALSEYKIGLRYVTDIGLYFYDTDYILTSSYKYSFDDFLNLYSGTSPEQIQEMTNFFHADTSNFTILSTFKYKDYSDARLFIGIPVTINNKHKALVFYTMRYDSISTSFFGTQSTEQLRLCIFDHNGSLMYTNRRIDPLLLKNEGFASYITDTDSTIFKYDYNTDDRYTVFKSHNAQLGNVFVSIVPQNQIEKSFKEFYDKMKNITILIAISSLLMIMGAVYVNYKPILKLVRSVANKHGNTGLYSEIDTITQAFYQIEEHVSEQEMLLMDYLLSNLLYGISISKTDAERLDVNFLNGTFCVLTIADIKLDSVGREQLEAHIQMESNIHTYITDILCKNHIVLICILEDEKQETIENLERNIKQYLYDHNSVSYKIGIGHIVNQLDDIQKSYMNALYSMESASISLSSSNTEVSVIEDYPSEDIALFLQYVKNGQMSNALKVLEEVKEYLINKVNSVLFQRYICYDILTAYIKCLDQISYPISKKETSDLLAHNNLVEFYDTLSISVKQVCESISSRNEDIQSSLQKQILDYINNNYTDPNMSRTQVADHFGISIYSLSRLFKSIIGIGLSEYITAKRMELSKQLLLITDKTITQIATEIGINDSNYFSKLFKTTWNMTPSRFRKQHEAE